MTNGWNPCLWKSDDILLFIPCQVLACDAYNACNEAASLLLVRNATSLIQDDIQDLCPNQSTLLTPFDLNVGRKKNDTPLGVIRGAPIRLIKSGSAVVFPWNFSLTHLLRKNWSENNEGRLENRLHAYIHFFMSHSSNICRINFSNRW